MRCSIKTWAAEAFRRMSCFPIRRNLLYTARLSTIDRCSLEEECMASERQREIRRRRQRQKERKKARIREAIAVAAKSAGKKKKV